MLYFPYNFKPPHLAADTPNEDTQCAEVHDVKTGTLEHSFGDEGRERWRTAG